MRDVDYAATDFPDLNFIVEHVGLPRLDDFCFIAAQVKRLRRAVRGHGLLASPATLLRRDPCKSTVLAGPGSGPCFGSDYAIWTPKWLIENFMAYQMPEDLKQEYHADLTPEIKRKILGENVARLYGIDVAAQAVKLKGDGMASASG